VRGTELRRPPGTHRNRGRSSWSGTGLLTCVSEVQSQEQPRRSLPPQGDFGAIYTKHARVAPGCAMGANHRHAGQKPKFHKALRDIWRQVDAVQNALFASFELGEGSRGLGDPPSLLETQLHYDPSMKAVVGACQDT
jgi:hypothetical protein